MPTLLCAPWWLTCTMSFCRYDLIFGGRPLKRVQPTLQPRCRSTSQPENLQWRAPNKKSATFFYLPIMYIVMALDSKQIDTPRQKGPLRTRDIQTRRSRSWTRSLHPPPQTSCSTSLKCWPCLFFKEASMNLKWFNRHWIPVKASSIYNNASWSKSNGIVWPSRRPTARTGGCGGRSTAARPGTGTSGNKNGRNITEKSKPFFGIELQVYDMRYTRHRDSPSTLSPEFRLQAFDLLFSFLPFLTFQLHLSRRRPTMELLPRFSVQMFFWPHKQGASRSEVVQAATILVKPRWCHKLDG